MKRKISIFMIFMVTAIYSLGAITVSKESNVATYVLGEIITYTIRVENDDNLPITDLVVTDDMSELNLENFSLVTATTNNVSSNYGTPIISGKVFSTGSFILEASDGTNNRYVEYTFTGKVSTGTTGNIINTASAKGTGVDVTSDSVIISEFNDSAIKITKTADVSEYDNGDDITYTIKVTNSSDKKIEGLTVTDNFFSSAEEKDGLYSLVVSNPQVISANSSGGSSNVGNYSSPSAGTNFVATNVMLDGKGSSVTYILKGTINKDIKGTLNSSATAIGTFINKSVIPTGIDRIDYNYTATMNSDATNNSYTPGEDVTYTLFLNNITNNTIKGLEITDILSTLKAPVLGGAEGLAFNNINISATTTGTGSENGLTSNPLNGDLEVRDVSIGPNGSVTYTITATVNSNVVGDILNSIEIKETTRNDNITVKNISLSSTPTVTITENSSSKSMYTPGDELTYTVTVKNSGSGIAEAYNIKHLLSTIFIDLANDSSEKESSTDIVRNPFVSGNVTMTSIGTNSSSNYTDNPPAEGLMDINDVVTIFPGESISYEVVVETDPSAIGKITSEVTVTDKTVTISSKEITVNPKGLNSDNIEIVKTTNTIQYTPGDSVTYRIEVTNNDTEKFANNISVIDSINSITALQLDGTTKKTFSSWTLNVESPTSSSNGTKPGIPISGTSTDEDINFLVDLAPGETIMYNLVAVIAETTVGTILDNVENGLDNVLESGNGIQMGPSKLNVSKNVDKTEYSPNEVITYEIIVENGGDGYATGIKVQDILSGIKSKTKLGPEEYAPAYSSWKITSRLESIESLDPTGDSGLESDPLIGSQSQPTNLDVTAIIGPKTRLIYEIKATIDGRATGEIKNEATIDGTLVADRGIFPIKAKVSASKSVAENYVYTGGDFVVTYNLKIENASDGGYASGVSIEDNLTTIGTSGIPGIPVLEGTTNLSFDSYKLTNIAVDGNGTVDLGAAITNDILTGTANITAGGSIIYTIKATVLETTINETNIPYGCFTNTATITHDEKTHKPSATTGPKYPSLSITKTADKIDLSNDEAKFTVRIENNGPGYANNAIVTDSLPTGLTNLVVTESKDSLGLGTDSSIDSDPINITTGLTVDIAPGGGWVEYHIKGNVVQGATIISNTAEVEDTQNNLIYKASAKIDDTKNADIEITKTVSSKTHTPGETIVYTITVKNKSTANIDFADLKYTVEDLIEDYPNYNLANEGTSYVDIKGHPFSSWIITRDGMTSIENKNLEDQPIIAGSGSVVYTVTAVIKDTLLAEQKLTNTTRVKNTSNDTLALASVQTNGAGNYGGRTVSLDKNKYIPGTPLTYTIRFAGGSNGYYNNFTINEALNSMTVETLDGTFKHPFVDANLDTSYTVVRSYKLDNSVVNLLDDGSSSSISEFPDGGVNTNSNLTSSEVDLGPGDWIEYKVTGVVRPDAIGTITYSDESSNPYRHNLNTIKKLSTPKYTPGEDMTYLIEISNASTGNANDISIYDEISALTVELSDDTTGPAFDPMKWEITTESGSESTSINYTEFVNPGTVTDNENISTTFDLPINTKLIYRITAKANPKAIGDIQNVVTVDEDTVTGQAKSGNPDISSKKEINVYYDRNGSTLLSGGYKPGGWIEYLITIENTGTGIMDNLTLVDKISEIQSTYVDGSTGDAFSMWNISVVESTGDATSLNLGTLDIDTPENDTDLDGTVDLSPIGKIVIKVKAKVDERAVGSIENVAIIGGIIKKSGKSEMLNSLPTISKKAYTADTSENITSIVKTEFNPGDTFYYKIKINNNGNGISSGTVTDAILSIRAQIPETEGSVSSPTAFPFSSWEITAVKGKNSNGLDIGDGSTYNDGKDNVTSLETFGTVPVLNSNISSNIYIAPGAYVEYTIKAVINNNVLSQIRNVARYTDQIKTVTNGHNINPINASIDLKKSIVYIGADPVNLTNNQTLYSPGDYVVYQIEIENIGDSFGNNIVISDLLSEMTSEVAGGNIETVFDSWKITDNGGLDSRTYVSPYTSTANLNTEMDIAQGDTVTFIVKAKTKETLIGQIPGNTVSATNAEDVNTSSIDPKDPKIEYYQTFIDISGTLTELPDNYEYIPYGKINYRVVVENTGEGYGNNISVKSILEDIISAGGEGAFSGATSYIIVEDKDGKRIKSTTDSKNIVTGTMSGTGLLDVNLDIEPGGRVEFYLSGTVEGRATGNIVSTVDVTGGDASISTGKSNTVTAVLSDAVVTGSKTATTTYVPGGEISFDIEIRNSSDSTADGIQIKDILKDIMVDTADGSNKPALKTGSVSITEVEVTNDENNSDISELLAQDGDPINLSSGSIDATVTLGSRKTSTNSNFSALKIHIEGKVIDDAVGIIENTLEYTYDEKTLEANTTTNPEIGKITIKNTAITSETNETEDASYIPGENKTFLVEVTNTGSGYANKVDIQDIITEIKTELAGEFSDSVVTKDFAFDTTSPISVEVKADGTDHTYQVGSIDKINGFLGKLNIYPGDTYKIKITGKIKKSAIGNITTIASATYNNGTTNEKVEDDAIVSTVDSIVSINKKISLDGTTYESETINYIPGDKIYYKITVSNTGSGWANDVQIVDNISLIESEISGTTGNGIAFDPDTIDISYDTTAISSGNIFIDTSLDNLSATFDLAPKSNLEFYISGNVKNNITGQIDNTATFSSLSGDVTTGSTNTVIAKPKNAVITILKEVVGGNTEYSIDEEIHYRISVTNTSDSFANDLKIVDIIKGDSGIKTDDSIDLDPIDAFVSFNIESPPLGDISEIVSTVEANGVDVTVDLAPKDTIIFDIYATVTSTAIGDIINTASYVYNGQDPVEKTVTLNPKKATLGIVKTSLTTTVIPKEEVIFQIEIKNTGEGIANDVVFTDDLSLILATLSDGTIDKAIKENSVTARVIESTKTTPAIPTINTQGNKVTSTLDIAPGGSIVVEVKGTLVDNIVGSITNTGKYEYINNGDTEITTGSSSVIIGAGNSEVSIEKTAIVDPNLGGYIPGEELEFRIKVHNNGPGIANNINVFDEMDKIIVETVLGDKKAFSKWKIEVVNGGSTKLPSLIPNIFPIEDSNLNVDVDIAPGDTLEFKITATVISDAFGDILNTAKASYENDLNNDGVTKVLPVFDSASFIPSRSDVKIEKTEDKAMYAPGEEITYTITLTGLGPGIAKKVNFTDNLNMQTNTTLGLGRALEAGKSEIISRELTGGATAAVTASITDDVVKASLNIPRGGKAVYTIKTIVANNTVGKIINTAKFTYTDNDGSAKEGEAFTNSDPINANLSITKTADIEEFVAGNPITYTVQIRNTGLGIANDVALKDLLMDIEVESVDGSGVKAFESVTITDNISALSSVSSVESYDPNKNLDTLLDIAPGDTAEFVIVGVTNKLAGKDITNKAEYSFNNNDGTLSHDSAEVTSKVKLNEGELVLTKQAFKNSIEKGEVVEYEIIVRNPTDVYFTGVSVEDKTPVGFKYVKDTTAMTLSGPDGDFKTDDDEDISDEPIQGNTLSYTAVNIGPNESLRIRYIMKASIGTTFGKYVNTAYAVSGEKEVSNRDSATVEVIPDALFDTATIIGKVYEDFNGDGYQADATATKIEIKGGVSVASYIPNSTTLEIDGKVESVEDASPPLQHGITIGQLRGISRNRKIKEPSKAIIRYETIDTKWEPLNVTSKAGTQLYIDSDGNVTTNHKNDLKKGLANEKLKVTRNVYKQKGKSTYLQEIVLENIGLYEDGIPGVRLITVEGVVIETDEFGRYHVPDEWVLRKTGKNFIVKVDEDSVPQGMQVISENPRVRRITPNGLNKFNFSVQRIEDDFDIGDTKGIIKIGGNENE